MKKVVLFAGGGCLLAFGIAAGLVLLAVWARGATETLSLDVAGVCIEAPEPGYSAEGGGDWMVMNKAAGPQVRLEIGSGPQLSANTIEAARANPGAFIAVANADGQFVTSEPAPGSRIVHVKIARASEAERERLLSLIRFCPEEKTAAEP